MAQARATVELDGGTATGLPVPDAVAAALGARTEATRARRVAAVVTALSG